MSGRRSWVGVWLVATLLATGSLAGSQSSCSRTSPPGPSPLSSASAEAGPPIDPPLLAFLSRARSAHHRADAFEEQGHLGRAIVELMRVIDGPLPRPNDPYPETREVLADTHARLADLRSRQGQFEEALSDIQAGLGLAAEPTYFRGHLFEVKGLVEERRSQALREAGDDAGSERARQHALEAFDQAMTIQAKVIESALSEEGPR